jgi:hypothetical protein
MGLISIARYGHPVGVRRGVVGGRFQGFTPLAINFRPLGTKNKTRCNPCPLIDSRLWIDSTSSIHRTPCIDTISWIHGTPSIHSTSSIHRTPCIDAISWIHGTPSIDSTSSIHRTPCIDAISWIHGTSSIDSTPPIRSTSSIHSISWVDATSRISTESLIVLSRNAAEVNSQGREPLETVTLMLLSRNAATVIDHIKHRHQFTRTIVNRHLSQPNTIEAQKRLNYIPSHAWLIGQLATLGHAKNLESTSVKHLDQNSSNLHYRTTNSTSGLVPSPRYSGERVRVRGLSLHLSRSESPPNKTRPTPQPSRPGVTRESIGARLPHPDLHPPVKKTSHARIPLAVPGISPPQNGNHLSRREFSVTNDYRGRYRTLSKWSVYLAEAVNTCHARRKSSTRNTYAPVHRRKLGSCSVCAASASTTTEKFQFGRSRDNANN